MVGREAAQNCLRWGVAEGLEWSGWVDTRLSKAFFFGGGEDRFRRIISSFSYDMPVPVVHGLQIVSLFT